VLGLDEIDRTQVDLVGGKGANLGELSRIEGVRVPAGFCITTDAFRRIIADVPSIDSPSAELRRSIERIAMPDDLAVEIARAIARLGEKEAYAVRSSATAEDSPTASFAGQQDSYLDIVGTTAILEHVSRCWASLFTERAVTYRLRNGIDHRKVHMAVVVQRMVSPHAAGVLFTADPVTGNRKVVSIDATYGFGEALVSGLVNPDVFKVRDGAVIAKEVRGKTSTHGEPTLTDRQAVQLAALGRRIEAHFGSPQDIEWCLVHDEFHIVQSRPITTLFPIPVATDQGNHVYLSVGHQQMMTDAWRPLGISLWQLMTMRPMYEAGGRLFVDVAKELASSASRARLFELAGRSDPLTGDALRTILERGDFVMPLPDASPAAPAPLLAPPAVPIETDPAIPAALIAKCEDSIAALEREIRTETGTALLDFILADIQEHKKFLFDPVSMHVIMAGIDSAWWLNDRLQEWLGEKNAADTLSQSVANNVTSEMGLALLDVADVIRPHAGVVAFLQQVRDDGFLDELPKLAGGTEARDAIAAWLGKYGMRGAGEIDITRPRWSERPTMLVPMILNNIRTSEPGDGARRFERGRQAASRKEQDVLQRLHALPDGEQKAQETKRMIDRVRTFAGYREYPKYAKIKREFVYKKALMQEAERLVKAGVLREREDIFHLRFEELHEVVRTQRADGQLIRRRKEEFETYRALTPPRVSTSDGEAITGAYRRDDLPAGALVGLPVSAGTVEGRARVILDMAKADLETGDILVTTFTDPSWTPLFVAIKGLVTEVGGLTTHGAVIAREYGLPAVVGVEHATRLIEDGQRIRVHGTEGYVEILS